MTLPLFSYPPHLSHMQASESRNAGNLEEARHYGRLALFCNLGTLVYYVIAVIVTVIAVAVAVTSDSNDYDYNYDY